MIGRKNIKNVWKEEFELNIIDGECKNIDETLELTVDDMLVEFTTKEISGYTKEGLYKYNNIEYCIYIPHSNRVFKSATNLEEQFNDNEELLEKLSLIRESVEQNIENYLESNGYIF